MRTSTGRDKMRRIAQALFEHGTVQKAAAALGMSPVTVWRWKQKPEFEEANREIRREALSRSGGLLLHGYSAAATTMLKLALDPSSPASVRQRAAEAVLAHAKKTFELEDIETRLKRLEK